MATKTFTLRDLAAELRALPKRDIGAVRRGLERTAKMDAPRWIQWAINGGGYTAPPPPPKPEKPPRVARKGRRKKRKAKVAKPAGPCPRKRPPTYRKPVDTGDYARTWQTTFDGNKILIWSGASPAVKAGVIERGRRPAAIPIAPLAEWVRRKLGCSDPDAARGIAIAISKSARKNRRAGLGVLERAHPKIAEAAYKNVMAALGKTNPGDKPEKGSGDGNA